MIVYSNSCSFGVRQPHRIYSDLILEKYGSSVVNAGKNGSCNRRIIRTTLRDLIELQNKHNDNILCLVGLTFFTRTELWQPTIPVTSNDGNFQPIVAKHSSLNWSKGLSTEIDNIHLCVNQNIQEYYKQWLLHMSKEAIITDTVTDIVMLVNFCLQNDIKVLVFNNTQLWPKDPEVAIEDVFLKSLVDKMSSYKNVINPWTFSFKEYSLSLGHQPKDKSKYGLDGHPNEDAHIDFGKFLIEYIEENKIL